MALCVDNSVLQHCALMMTEAFGKEGLEVRSGKEGLEVRSRKEGLEVRRGKEGLEVRSRGHNNSGRVMP